MSDFTVRETPIPGLLLFTVTSHDDDRGYFQEKYQAAKLQALGMPKTFAAVQTNAVLTRPTGTLRGIHAEPWDKYVTVAVGSAFCAAVDLRKGPNFGTVFTFELDLHTTAYIPAGVGNSYQTKEADTLYVYNVSGHHDPSLQNKYVSLNPADPALGIMWPTDLAQANLSERDKHSPYLADIKPIEV